MANIMIRNLGDNVKTRLRDRTAQYHRCMEEEMRIILRDAVNLVRSPGPSEIYPR